MKLFIIIILYMFTTSCCYAQDFYFTYQCIAYKQLSYEDFQKQIRIDTTYWHYSYREYDSIKYIMYDIPYKTHYIDSISDEEISHVAMSSLSIASDYRFESDSFIYSIYSCFLPKGSYMVIKTKDILDHEQIHLDICELYSRKIKQAIIKAGFANLDSTKLLSIINIYNEKMNNANDAFDSCTKAEDKKEAFPQTHKRSGKVNKDWHLKLNRQMDELKDYQRSEGVLYSDSAKHKKLPVK